jgi:hypothetical protein
MKLIKTDQTLLGGSLKTNVTAISKLSCGTEMKLSVSKVFETRRSSDTWYLINREIIRSNLINLENRFYRRSLKPTKALINLAKKTFQHS